MIEGPVVNQSIGPPVSAWTTLYFYDGSSDLEFICHSRPNQPEKVLKKVLLKSDASLTEIVVSSDVATVETPTVHGLQVGDKIVISGATVDTDLNGTYIVTSVPTTTTFTFVTVDVSDATYTEGTLEIAVSDDSLINIIVSTNVGTALTVADHGLQVGNIVIISGATVDTDLNGTYVIASVPSTKSFTFATIDVADATYVDATLQYATTAPRTTEPIWAINRYQYSGGKLTHSQWADGNSTDDNVADDRATLAYS